MTNNRRRRATTVATALLAGGAVAAVATRARREHRRPRAMFPVLELTPSHRGGTGTPLLLLHGIGAIWRVWSPVLPHLEPHHDVIAPPLPGPGVGASWRRWCAVLPHLEPRHDVIAPTLPGHGGAPPLDPQTAPSIQALT